MSVSFRKRGSKWYYSVKDKKGRTIESRAFKTKKEAQIVGNARNELLFRGYDIANEKTLYELWQEWYQTTIVPQNKREYTLYLYELRGRWIKEYLSDVPATKIKYSRYQSVLTTLGQKQCKNVISRFNSDVRKVIAFARRDKIDIDDFTQGALITSQKIGKKPTEKSLTNLSDYMRLKEAIKRKISDKYVVSYYVLFVALKTGLRAGENLGLTWDCIDFEKKTIKTYRRYDTSKRRFCPPKTETSVREVPIDDELIEVLRQLKESQNKLLNKYAIKNEENFIYLTYENKVPLRYAANQCLQRILKREKIYPSQLTLTSLRHSYASYLLAKGIDIWVVSNVMGHKNIEQVTKTYGHLLKEKRDNEFQLIRQSLI
ncbi:tyrosine-type recombinase/integrase [Streptococcus sp. zg-JUN1979]|uniref:tyrosine-type recombinase/integrase n=1 Tax=Streptococcus sp. zg-JUN1979 TaxID=3391450 RepID=UPI0039A575DC